MMLAHGHFPFGKPNTTRPARLVTNADAVVVGVYPSAWHVTWQAPRERMTAGAKGRVTALAVDVEPTVFWDGASDDFAERLRSWKHAVGFIDGKHGNIPETSPGTNGSSGDKVVKHYLAPLGLSAARTTFTDVYPVFMVKMGRTKTSREQGAAIVDEYDPIAGALGFSASTLPARIAPTKLPALAAERFGRHLRNDLEAAAAPLVITLGKEVWETFIRIPELDARPPTRTFDDLKGEPYGSAGTIRVNGREVRWLPLVHPGLLQGIGREGATGWTGLHAQWAGRPR